jgi:two-component system, OmpR family, phosphate regulon sensor histidine kinase PhoR
MTAKDFDKLGVLIKEQQETLLVEWRQQVRQLPAAKNLDTPTLNDHIPSLLDELSKALRAGTEQSIPEAFNEGSPPAHGVQRVADGFDIAEVVAEYNILRGCIHDLATDNGLALQGRLFHVINRVLDEAIGLAVQAFATQRALEVQQRREEYLTFVAHDLRTPLNAISLAVRILELTLPAQNNSAEINQMLKSLGRNTQHLATLVGKVLEENANLQTEVGVKVERRRFDLWPLVEALVHDLHPVAGTDSTQLINNVPDDLVVFGDASLLRRVFQNLIANAIKHTPRGQVVIAAADLGPTVGVECSVTDNGAGISPEFIDKVFEKGEADTEVEGVTGLGLAIVKTFVEAHGGTVTVESQEGLGSTFRFLIPSQGRI